MQTSVASWFNLRMITRESAFVLLVALALIVALSSATAAGTGRPPSVHCVLVSASGCAPEPDGPCILSEIRSEHSTTYDFAKRRFRSNWGSGRITQMWDEKDGSHAITIAAPPAGDGGCLLSRLHGRDGETAPHKHEAICLHLAEAVIGGVEFALRAQTLMSGFDPKQTLQVASARYTRSNEIWLRA